MRAISRTAQPLSRTAHALLLTLAVLLGILVGARAAAARPEDTPAPPGSVVDLGRASLHLIQQGQGAPVVLLHGAPGFAEELRGGTLEQLAQHHRVIALDRPGYGYSGELTAGTGDMPDQAQLIHQAITQLGLDRPIIVGHSWSGALALHYAQRYPQETRGIVHVAGVVFLTPAVVDAVQRSRNVPDWVNLIATLVPTARASGVDQIAARAAAPAAVDPAYLAAARAAWARPAAQRALARDMQSVPAGLQALDLPAIGQHVPVAIIVGAEDRVMSPGEQGQRLATQLASNPSAHARLWEAAGTGHNVHQARPDLLEAALTWLAGQ
ncbi:MAG: alpha/beta hydrolase [Chloroflexota bacterium]